MNKAQQEAAIQLDRRTAEYLALHPQAGRNSVAQALSITVNQAQRAIKRVKSGDVLATQLPPCNGPVQHRKTDSGVELDTGNSTEIRTLEQLLKTAQVDEKRWKVERHVINKYSVATKDEETAVVTVTDLWQVKATLIPVPGMAEADALREVIADLRLEAKVSVPNRVKYVSPALKKDDDPVLLEMSPFDLHHGKLAWAQETGVPYDIKLSEAVFLKAIVQLWERAKGFPVQRVALVLGQDFFTADNSADTTTAGTPQHVDVRFAKSFRSGWRMMRTAIEYLRIRCNDGVDVIIVPGNHDTDTAFCAGEVLSALYEHTKDVRVDNGPSLRKYFRFGVNLLGFTHGDKEKHAQLPLIMANERPQDWSETTTREIHLGHLHHSKSTTFVSGSEHNSIRVRVLPSLSSADSWHHTHGYIAKRAAEAYLWGFKRGYIGHLSWSP